ncbi:MAG: hypothetical protein GDA50_00910 [Alphaproteobacteria bacterium GM202ARS2]|nr:hypothetical protein [Alphaproteobacteria bacterium GM202ARS2]
MSRQFTPVGKRLKGLEDICMLNCRRLCLFVSCLAVTGCGSDFFSDRYIDTDHTIQSARERDEAAQEAGLPTSEDKIRQANRDELRQEIVQRIRAQLARKRALARKKREQIQPTPAAATPETEATLQGVLRQNVERRQGRKPLLTPVTITFAEDPSAYGVRLLRSVKEQLQAEPQAHFILDTIAPDTDNPQLNQRHHKRAIGKIKEISAYIRKHTALQAKRLSYSIINREQGAETITLLVSP